MPVKPPQPETSPFPIFSTGQEAVQEIRSRLPIRTFNELVAALSIYHNSVLAEVSQSPGVKP